MKKLLQLQDTSWIHLVNPSNDEIDEIIEKYDLHEIIEQDLKETSTQDKIDIYDDRLFLVLHFPKYKIAKHRHFSNELKFIVGKKTLISLSTHTTQTIEKIKSEYLESLKDADENEVALRSSPYYILYKILDALYDKSLNGLKKFNNDLVRINEKIFDEHRFGKDILERLMIKSRNISLLKNIIQPQSEILEELNNLTKKLFEGNLDVYFEDLAYKVDKIENLIKNLENTTDDLSGKYNTLVTLRTNSIVSVLTIVTVIVGFLTLITGFYGMNVQLPGQENSLMRFWIVFGMLLLAVVSLLIFQRKKWL